MYESAKFPGEDGVLGVHPILGGRIEIWVMHQSMPVILTRKEFQELCAWVETQFQAIEKQQPRYVH